MAKLRSRRGVSARARSAGPPRARWWPALTALAAGAVATEALLRCRRLTSQLARRAQRLEQVSRTDPLTELPNRRHLEEHLAVAASAARRHDQPLTVLLADIDGFKEVNDELGYEAGDAVLRAVSRRMREALRVEDILGRWGGEEFVAVLPTTDLAGAVAVAERVRAAIAAEPVVVREGKAQVTVSLGCASWAGEQDETVRAAGRALRQAKRAGKNQVVALD